LIQEYQKVTKYNSLIRVVFPLFVLAIITVFILVTVMGVMSAFPEKRITTETVKAGEELLPVLNKVMKSFVDEVAPQLADEFQRGLEEGADRLAQSLAQEIVKLEAESGEYVKVKVHEAIALSEKEHRALLLELFPELKDDPERLAKLSARLNKAFEMWTVKYMLGILEDYYLVMAKINDTVIKGYRPDPAKDGQAAKVQEGEMMELFLELMNAAYTDTEEGGAAADEANPVEEAPSPAPEEEPVKAPVEASAEAPEKAPEAAAPEAAEEDKTKSETE